MENTKNIDNTSISNYMCSRASMAADYLKGDQIAMFQDTFNKFDTDADGAVNCKEVGLIMRAVGQNPSEAEIQVEMRKFNGCYIVTQFVQDMVMVVDKDGTGSIDFPEFLMMMALKINSENAEDDIREAFKVFDGVRKALGISVS